VCIVGRVCFVERKSFWLTRSFDKWRTQYFFPIQLIFVLPEKSLFIHNPLNYNIRSLKNKFQTKKWRCCVVSYSSVLCTMQKNHLHLFDFPRQQKLFCVIYKTFTLQFSQKKNHIEWSESRKKIHWLLHVASNIELLSTCKLQNSIFLP
jgi:hypothetical protein